MDVCWVSYRKFWTVFNFGLLLDRYVTETSKMSIQYTPFMWLTIKYKCRNGCIDLYAFDLCEYLPTFCMWPHFRKGRIINGTLFSRAKGHYDRIVLHSAVQCCQYKKYKYTIFKLMWICVLLTWKNIVQKLCWI